MNVTPDHAPLLKVYLASLHPPNLRAARLVATAALDSGVTPAHFVDTVLRPAQEEVGRRWQDNEWTVAQEHAATAIADAVLELISLRTPRSERSPATTVVGCVEGEWHTMPARMLTATLRASGHDVVFLGPSLPATQFARSLNDHQPLVALLSCTNPINLPAARRTIEVAHNAGVSVIIGGRALDAGGIRAKALGADAWAPTPAGAASILAAWGTSPPPRVCAADLCPEGTELEFPGQGLIADCLDELIQRAPMLQAMTPAQLGRTREDITYILQFCSAALSTQDHTVLDEFTIWLHHLLAPRNVPAHTIRTSYQSIAAVLGGGFPKTTSMLAAAITLI